uniref:Uncharacterized protein n=1 Tax=Ciona savignyi TaxID=51511 RepID=H2YXB1_CIOSA
MKSRPRLHAQVRSPESTNKDSRMNSAPTQSNSDTAHRKLRNGEGPSSSAPGYLSPIPCSTCSPSVQYAELSLAADEEEEISYAKLLLNDEEDYYKHLIDNNHGIALKPTSPTVSVQSSQKNSSSLKRTSDVDSGLAEEGVLSPSQE